MSRQMSIAEAKSIAGSLGFPAKLPGTSYGLPALACILGQKLAKIPGTVCSTCYALKGGAFYQMPRAAIGANRRLIGLRDPRWVAAVTHLLLKTHAKPSIKVDLGLAGERLKAKGGSRYQYNQPGYHRWHDSGDIQSVEHLSNICQVARNTPNIKHWLPTQELSMVKAYLATGAKIPDNLVIRVSSIRVNDRVTRNWPLTSSVFESVTPIGYICPARDQEHKCGSCRACWSPDVPHVAYPAH